MNDIEETLDELGIQLNSPHASPNTLQDSDFNQILQQHGFDVDTPSETVDLTETIDVSAPSLSLEDISEPAYLIRDALNHVYEQMRADLHLRPIMENANPDNRILPLEALEEEPESGEKEEEEGESTPPHNLIEENSPTLLIDVATSRFSGAEWFEDIKQQSIILAGLGGIGSWTALQIARMCPDRIFLYDDDIVERANMSGQLYSIEDADYTRFKADALEEILENFTTVGSVYAFHERFTSNSTPGPIMICGFDNMDARKVFFNQWKLFVESCTPEMKKKCLFIDGRLSMNILQVLAITGDSSYSINSYEEDWLFSDSEADETVCSMKQTSYLACMIGSFITNVFTNFVASLKNPLMYKVPFLTEYNAQHMILKINN